MCQPVGTLMNKQMEEANNILPLKFYAYYRIVAMTGAIK